MPETETLDMLERLTTVASVVNSTQHAGAEVTPAMWAELYQLTNEAWGLIARVRKSQQGKS